MVWWCACNHALTLSHPHTQICTQSSMHVPLHASMHACKYARKYACKLVYGYVDGGVRESSYWTFSSLVTLYVFVDCHSSGSLFSLSPHHSPWLLSLLGPSCFYVHCVLIEIMISPRVLNSLGVVNFAQASLMENKSETLISSSFLKFVVLWIAPTSPTPHCIFDIQIPNSTMQWSNNQVNNSMTT